MACAMLQLSLEAKRRITAAQSTRFDWTKAASIGLHSVVEAHANAVGSPKEFIFLPMLTVAAAFMGINAVVQINEEWLEPAILWTVVAARKGEKKTAALKRILRAVEEIEDVVEKWSKEKEPKDVDPPQLVVQQFSMEALHHIMLRNECQMLGLYDEMSVMYGQLDAYKHSGSTLDRSTLLDLYNGGSWARNFKNRSGPSKMLKTAFNMSGFIQPVYVLSMLDKCDADGFNDRQLFDCPPEIEFKYNDLKIPVDAAIPPLSLIFKLIRAVHNNRSKITYTMSDEAKEAYIKYHDSLVERKQAIPDDENRRGVLSKAKGQCARLSMISHVLDKAVATAIELHDEHRYSDEDIDNKCLSWLTEITVEAVHFATTLTDHFIAQKFALMPAEVVIGAELDINVGELLSNNQRHLSRFLMDNSPSLTASDICRRRLIPPTSLDSSSPDTKTKYPVQRAKQFMQEVATAGFGITETVKSGKKSSLTFKKRKYSELGEQQLDILKKLKISRDSYEANPDPTEEHSSEASTSGSSSSLLPTQYSSGEEN